MIVVDASAVVDLLLRAPGRGPALEARVRAERSLASVQLLDLEVASALRRKLHHGDLDEARAAVALGIYRELRIRMHPHRPLLARIWELRSSLSPYDAAYVALAERLGVSLLTTDERMARADGHRASIFTP